MWSNNAASVSSEGREKGLFMSSRSQYPRAWSSKALGTSKKGCWARWRSVTSVFLTLQACWVLVNGYWQQEVRVPIFSGLLLADEAVMENQLEGRRVWAPLSPTLLWQGTGSLKLPVWCGGLPGRWSGASELIERLYVSFALAGIHADFVNLTELLVVLLDKSCLGVLSSAAAASCSFLPLGVFWGLFSPFLLY